LEYSHIIVRQVESGERPADGGHDLGMMWAPIQATKRIPGASRFVRLLRRLSAGIAGSSPDPFTSIRGRTPDGHDRVFFYLYTREKADLGLKDADEDQPLHAALNLRESGSTPALEGETPAGDADDLAVVLEKGEVSGFFDVTEPGLFTRGSRGVLCTGEMTTRYLEAYPVVEAPTRVAPGETFDIAVGFSPDPDPLGYHTGRVHFSDLRPDEECLVVLVTEGVEVNPNYATLPVRANARAFFSARARAAEGTATIRAQFFHRNQLVGMVLRELEVTSELGGSSGTGAESAGGQGRFSFPGPESHIDLTVTVTYSSDDGTLQWTWSAPVPPRGSTDPLRTRLEGAREFGANLLSELKDVAFTGPFALNILENKGRAIADLIPPPLFDDLRKVHEAIGRPPTLLLVTNESFVPWELALLDPPLDPTRRSFLADQTQMGHWLADKRVLLPPTTSLDVRRATAVAGTYSLQTGLRELKEAVAERAMLATRWNFIPLEARLDDLLSVVSGAVTPGHLIHFAVHGLSDPTENRQVLLLSDRKRLPAAALVSPTRLGQFPRFAFVFMNACQVGTAGISLGLAAGFPGLLVRNGACGFIAPMWDVDDGLARALAERFYEAVFERNETVGSVIHAARGEYQGASTTPIAYIYYGHPALRLNDARN
jgi:hypothetical protein